MGISREYKVVVKQLVVTAIQAKVENNARTGWFVIPAPKKFLSWSAIK
jgi:hypothetical protein